MEEGVWKLVSKGIKCKVGSRELLVQLNAGNPPGNDEEPRDATCDVVIYDEDGLDNEIFVEAPLSEVKLFAAAVASALAQFEKERP